MELEALRAELRTQLLVELLPALELLARQAAPSGEASTEVILLKARLEQLNRDRGRGLLSYEEYDRLNNRLRADFLDLVNRLTAKDLLPADAPADAPRAEGALLHQIPPRMQTGQEVRCRVRLAYDEDDISQGIDTSLPTEIQPLRVDRIMQVRLFDASAEPAFAIRTLSREKQGLADDAYAEWLFFVKPLRTGRHPLLLLVAVVEKVDGEEVVREIVLEEIVEVAAEEQPAALGEDAWTPAGIRLGAVRAASATGSSAAPAKAPQMPPAPAPASPSMPAPRLEPAVEVITEYLDTPPKSAPPRAGCLGVAVAGIAAALWVLMALAS